MSSSVIDWSEKCRAQVLETDTQFGRIRHLRVWTHDGSDGIDWDTLQAIKDEMLGPDALAIEVYPPADQVVNEANIRHLFEMPDGIRASFNFLERNFAPGRPMSRRHGMS